MLYSILIYGSEAVVRSFSQAQEEAALDRHYALQAEMTRQGKLGPFARLMPTTAAVTIRNDGREPVVLDGPFAETKEQLLGFYMIECATLDEAVTAAKTLPTDIGSIEIRPIHYYQLGVLPPPEPEPAAEP